MSGVLDYKYDFELSSKRKIFLWLYQVIPNIDMIKYIYKLKENSERYDHLIYHGLCPKNILTTGKWIPINVNFPSMCTIQNRLNSCVRLMKFIMEPGFICTFTINYSDYVNIELQTHLQYYTYWSYIVSESNINMKSPLKDKIRCINKIFANEPFLEEDIFDRLNQLYIYYQNNDVCRIGLDQHNKYYIPKI